MDVDEIILMRLIDVTNTIYHLLPEFFVELYKISQLILETLIKEILLTSNGTIRFYEEPGKMLNNLFKLKSKEETAS